MNSSGKDLLQLLSAKANQLRIDSIKATTAAGSGHPTTCLSCAEIVSTLFFHEMRYDPKDPKNPNSDRFVLSKGHGAPILYAAWAEAGLFPREKLLTLREIDSDLEGHPTPKLPFVDVSTGSLGQGLGVGVGLALNSKFLDKSNYRTFVLLGDGEIAEGSVWEAAELATHYKLSNLVAIVDANRLGQSQPTMLQHHTEVYRARFEAFGFDSVAIDGHDVGAVVAALERTRNAGDKPYAIIACTYKGKGVSFAENADAWHGKPFKKGEEADKAIAEVAAAGIDSPHQWEVRKPDAVKATSTTAKQMEAPAFKKGDLIATREAYGTGLVKIGAANPLVVAVDADTKNSTYSDKFMKAYPDRFFECFIAEQNMISLAAGLAARGKIPFASSFAVFLSRGFDQVRMAGISGSNLKMCGSHVGVSIGEDGPSQMGLEDLALYRSIPNSVVFYPSDAVSTERAIELAAEHQGMAYIRTSRPKTPVIYDNDEKFAIGKAQVVRKGDKDTLTIVSGGVTLHEAIKAADEMAKDGVNVRIIDIFTVKPVDAKTIIAAAKETNNAIVTIEDHYGEGGIGEAVLSAVAETGIRVFKIHVNGVPRSGKPEELLEMYGIDAKGIAKRVKEIAAALK